jgi:hypothetical protein
MCERLRLYYVSQKKMMFHINMDKTKLPLPSSFTTKAPGISQQIWGWHIIKVPIKVFSSGLTSRSAWQGRWQRVCFPLGSAFSSHPHLTVGEVFSHPHPHLHRVRGVDWVPHQEIKFK